MSKELIRVEHLKKYFPVGHHALLKAVDDVSFSILEGETLGLVGESGCGKTTCGRTLLNLYNRTDGQVYFEGRETRHLAGKEIKLFKKETQMIFQDPYASLNPRMTIFDSVAEGLRVHFELSKKEMERRVNDILLSVGLTEGFGNRFPHELSGGQCQRIGIARALVVEPKLIVCDEPISALDVSIQAQIVNLLVELQRDRGLTYLFISHDLSMVKYISHRIGVMYLGHLVELCESKALFNETLHPYSQVLISAIPDPEVDESKRRKRAVIIGEVPSPINPPPGCKFSNRCTYETEICHREVPKFVEASLGHFVACHHYKQFMK